MKISFVVALSLVVLGCGRQGGPPGERPATVAPAANTGRASGAACSCGAVGDERHCATGLSCCCGPTSPNIASDGAGWCAQRCPEVNPAAGGGGLGAGPSPPPS